MFSLKFAQNILDAFGPCTPIYECRTADEVLENLFEDGLDVASFCSVSLSVHSIYCERDGCYDEYADKTGNIHHSHFEIVKRLELLGIDCSEIREKDKYIMTRAEEAIWEQNLRNSPK